VNSVDSVNRRRPIDVESASASCKIMNAWLLHARLKILTGGLTPGGPDNTENTRAGSLSLRRSLPRATWHCGHCHCHCPPAPSNLAGTARAVLPWPGQGKEPYGMENLPPAFWEAVQAQLNAGVSIDEIMAKMNFRMRQAQEEGDPTDPDLFVMRAAQGSAESLRKLVEEHGVDPSLPDYSGMTPLIFAAENANVPVMRLLLGLLLGREGEAAAAAICAQCPHDAQDGAGRRRAGFNALHAACRSVPNIMGDDKQLPPQIEAQIADAVELLVRYWVPLMQIEDAKGRKPLQLAYERWEARGTLGEEDHAPRSQVVQRLVGVIMDPYTGITAHLRGLAGARSALNGQRVAVLQPGAPGSGEIVVELLSSGQVRLVIESRWSQFASDCPRL
jgi:hypothetical protein